MGSNNLNNPFFTILVISAFSLKDKSTIGLHCPLFILEFMLNNNIKIMYDLCDLNKKTILHYLVKMCRHNELYEKCDKIISRILLDSDCIKHINDQDKKKKRTPLHYAVEYNLYDIIDKLIEYGADINIEDKDGLRIKNLNEEEDIVEISIDKINLEDYENDKTKEILELIKPFKEEEIDRTPTTLKINYDINELNTLTETNNDDLEDTKLKIDDDEEMLEKKLNLKDYNKEVEEYDTSDNLKKFFNIYGGSKEDKSETIIKGKREGIFETQNSSTDITEQTSENFTVETNSEFKDESIKDKKKK